MANKTAIVTAASQSIGSACAWLLSNDHNFLSGFIDSSLFTEDICKNITLGREMRVYEIVRGVLFLLSDDAKYITWQNLILDGLMVITEWHIH